MITSLASDLWLLIMSFKKKKDNKDLDMKYHVFIDDNITSFRFMATSTNDELLQKD